MYVWPRPCNCVSVVLSSNRNGKTTLTCHISSTSQVTSYEWIHVENDVNGNQTFTSVQKSTSKVLSIPKTKRQGEWVCRFYNQQQLLGNVTYHQQVMSEYCFKPLRNVMFTSVEWDNWLPRHSKCILLRSKQLYWAQNTEINRLYVSVEWICVVYVCICR